MTLPIALPIEQLPQLMTVGMRLDDDSIQACGRILVDWRGGPEVIQQFKQPNAVRIGSIDMTITSPSYANGILSVSGAANYSNKSYEEVKVVPSINTPSLHLR